MNCAIGNAAANPEAEKILVQHRQATALLRAAFAESQFANGATTAAPPAPVRIRRSAFRCWMAAAAGILIATFGYSVGAAWPGIFLSDRSKMLTEVAEYHAIYSRETLHLVEVPASQSEHLKAWLGRQVKCNLAIPDFSAAGLTFAGGRMVVGEADRELVHRLAASAKQQI
jgi:anti-sigma factor RsiW